jgi:hypothetical protein
MNIATFFKVAMFGKDVQTNPGREMPIGGLCPPSNGHLKRELMKKKNVWVRIRDSLPHPEEASSATGNITAATFAATRVQGLSAGNALVLAPISSPEYKPRPCC